MDARTVHASEVQIIALDARNLERSLHQFAAGAQCFHFSNGTVPEFINIRRTGVNALVGTKFCKRHIKDRHMGYLLSKIQIQTNGLLNRIIRHFPPVFLPDDIFYQLLALKNATATAPGPACVPTTLPIIAAGSSDI